MLIVQGMGASGVPGGGQCKTHLDHRIAMAFLCLGMAAKKPVSIDDGGPVATSFPVFEPLMSALGANFTRDNL
jgi:3-phosphoshikimate 1-carboxyvinyltransferase